MKEVTRVATIQITQILEVADDCEFPSIEADEKDVCNLFPWADDVVADIKYFVRDCDEQRTEGNPKRC